MKMYKVGTEKRVGFVQERENWTAFDEYHERIEADNAEQAIEFYIERNKTDLLPVEIDTVKAIEIKRGW